MQTPPLSPPAATLAPLAELLDEAGRTELDAATWEVLSRRARAVTTDLADAGVLPRHLVAVATDPPVVVARTLLAAGRAAALAAVTRAQAGVRPETVRCA